jgi:phosphoglycolate phosphatase
MIRAIALDLDGTLLDTLADLSAAANAARAAVGLPPLTPARIRSHIGDGMASLVHRSLTDQRDAEATPEQFALGMAGFNQHYQQHLGQHTTVYPGVHDALAAMQTAGWRLALVTNKSARFTQPLLQQCRLDHYFELVISGDTLPHKKPHPAPLMHVCQTFELQPPELVMIGDSHNDIAAAHAAGCPAVAVSYGFGSPTEWQGAAITVETLVEAVEFLKNAG